LWRVYVVSFCDRSDTALHWLHYGHSGSGVAIGFNSVAIQKPPYELCPVLYNRARQDDWIGRIVKTVDDALDAALSLTQTSDDRELLRDVALDVLATHLWMVTPRMKNLVFEAENEWRLVTYVPKGNGVPMRDDPAGLNDYRAASGRIVPYKKVAFDVLPVTEIVVGASAPIQQDRDALRVLMEETLIDCDQVKVSESAVPVRA
jgi:hypothetical protein